MGEDASAANVESRAGAGGARGSASGAYFRLPVPGCPHTVVLGKPHTVHMCAGALRFMPMSMSWVGERAGGAGRGNGAAGLGHAVIASSESDKNGLFLSDFGDEDGEWGASEPVYAVFPGIG